MKCIKFQQKKENKNTLVISRRQVYNILKKDKTTARLRLWKEGLDSRIFSGGLFIYSNFFKKYN